eukprot:3698792-Pleurochrysis_carterae.AAC.3
MVSQSASARSVSARNRGCTGGAEERAGRVTKPMRGMLAASVRVRVRVRTARGAAARHWQVFNGGAEDFEQLALLWNDHARDGAQRRGVRSVLLGDPAHAPEGARVGSA